MVEENASVGRHSHAEYAAGAVTDSGTAHSRVEHSSDKREVRGSNPCRGIKYKKEAIILAIAWGVWIWVSVLSVNRPPAQLRSPDPARRLIEERDGTEVPPLVRGQATSIVMWARRNDDTLADVRLYCKVSVDMREFFTSQWPAEERLLPGRYELKLTNYEMNAQILAIYCEAGNEVIPVRQLLTPIQ